MSPSERFVFSAPAGAAPRLPDHRSDDGRERLVAWCSDPVNAGHVMGALSIPETPGQVEPSPVVAGAPPVNAGARGERLAPGPDAEAPHVRACPRSSADASTFPQRQEHPQVPVGPMTPSRAIRTSARRGSPLPAPLAVPDHLCNNGEPVFDPAERAASSGRGEAGLRRAARGGRGPSAAARPDPNGPGARTASGAIRVAVSGSHRARADRPRNRRVAAVAQSPETAAPAVLSLGSSGSCCKDGGAALPRRVAQP